MKSKNKKKKIKKNQKNWRKIMMKLQNCYNLEGKSSTHLFLYFKFQYINGKYNQVQLIFYIIIY